MTNPPSFMRAFCRTVLFAFGIASLSVAQQPAITPAQFHTYHLLFQQVGAFQARAENLAAEAKSDRHVRDFHKEKLELSVQQASILLGISNRYNAQAQVLDRRADQLIRAGRAGNKAAGNGKLVQPPAELLQLQKQKEALVASARSELEAGLGAARFRLFESQVNQLLAIRTISKQ